jgi:hypothetical protein
LSVIGNRYGSRTSVLAGSGIATRSLSPFAAKCPTVTSGRGSAWRHASNCARFGTPLPTGRSSESSPCSGTQILSVHASQRAAARIGTVPFASAGTFSRTSTA